MTVQEVDALVVDELSDLLVGEFESCQVKVSQPVCLGESADADLRRLRALRELTSRAVRVRWLLAGRSVLPLRDHVHLVPPADGVDQRSAAAAAQWRAGYRYGACYYRIGPGFVTVKDVRPDGEKARMVIDGDGAELFRAMSGAHRISDLDSAGLDALATLAELGLASRGEQDYLLLPYRMRHWPVPYIAV